MMPGPTQLLPRPGAVAWPGALLLVRFRLAWRNACPPLGVFRPGRRQVRRQPRRCRTRCPDRCGRRAVAGAGAGAGGRRRHRHRGGRAARTRAAGARRRPVRRDAAASAGPARADGGPGRRPRATRRFGRAGQRAVRRSPARHRRRGGCGGRGGQGAAPRWSAGRRVWRTETRAGRRRHRRGARTARAPAWCPPGHPGRDGRRGGRGRAGAGRHGLGGASALRRVAQHRRRRHRRAAVVVLFLTLRASATEQRPETGWLALRGVPRRHASMYRTAPVVLALAAALPVGLGLGVAAGWLAAAGYARPAHPRLSLAALGLAALATCAGAIAAAAADRQGRAGGVGALMRRVPGRDNAQWVAAGELVAAVCAIAGVVLLRTGADNATGVALLTPALVALATGLIAARALVPVAAAVGRRLLARGRVGHGLALLSLGRRPGVHRAIVLVTVGLAMLGSAVGAWTLAAAARAERADRTLGAARVLTVDARGVSHLLSATRGADPDGRYAMAAVQTYGAPPVLAVDARALPAVARWRPEFGSPTPDEAVHRLRPDYTAPLTGAGSRLRLDLDADRVGDNAFVRVRLAPVDGPTVLARLGPLAPGLASYVTTVDGCATRCRLMALELVSQPADETQVRLHRLDLDDRPLVTPTRFGAAASVPGRRQRGNGTGADPLRCVDPGAGGRHSGPAAPVGLRRAARRPGEREPAGAQPDRRRRTAGVAYRRRPVRRARPVTSGRRDDRRRHRPRRSAGAVRPPGPGPRAAAVPARRTAGRRLRGRRAARGQRRRPRSARRRAGRTAPPGPRYRHRQGDPGGCVRRTGGRRRARRHPGGGGRHIADPLDPALVPGPAGIRAAGRPGRPVAGRGRRRRRHRAAGRHRGGGRGAPGPRRRKARCTSGMTRLVTILILARRAQSLTVLLLAALATAGAVARPMYTASAERAVLASAVASASPDERTLRTSAAGQPANAAFLAQATASLSLPGFQVVPAREVSALAGTSLAGTSPTGTSPVVGARTRLVFRDGFCDHVLPVSGRCPDGPMQVMVSEQTADRLALRIGAPVTVQAVQAMLAGGPAEPEPAGPPVDLALVGIYRPRDAASPYWAQHGYFAAPPGATPAFLVTAGTLAEIPNAGEVQSVDANASPEAFRVDQLAALRTGLAANDPAITGAMTALLDRIDAGRSVLHDSAPVAALPLVALCWFVLFLVASDGLLVALVAQRSAATVGRRALRRGRLTRGLAALQFARRPGGRRLVALVAIAVGLLGYAVASADLARQAWADRAAVELGAATVLVVQGEVPVRELLGAVAAVDPSGGF